MSGFNFGGTPSSTTSGGGPFGSGSLGSTSAPGFSFGSPAPSTAPTGQATPFAFGTSTPASTGTAPGFSLPNTGVMPANTGAMPGFSLANAGATPANTGGTPTAGFSLPNAGATPGSTAAGAPAAGGFSFAKPGGTPGFTCFGTPAGTPATVGFPTGTTKATASTGLNLTTSQTQAGSGGFSLGSTQGSGSLAGLLGQPNTTPQSGGTSFLTSISSASSSTVSTTATPALGGTMPGSSLLSLKTQVNAAASPGLGLTLTGGALKLGQATGTVQTTAQTTTGVAPILGVRTVASTVATATSAAPSLGFGTTATTSAPAVGFGLSTAATSSAASLGFGLSTASTKASTTTTPGAVASQKMNYKQLEEQINKWMTDLEEQERQFLLQATQVNAWDRLLVDNGEKITQLNNDKERVKVDQNKLEQELDFIKAQQRELEELLTPMEKSLEQLPSASYQQHADLERENTYQLAYNVDAQLKRMVQDLKEIIDHLNSSNSTQDTNDPILQITMILNAHMDSLQWIDTNTALLSRRVEDISKQMESQRKDQERNFRLVYD